MTNTRLKRVSSLILAVVFAVSLPSMKTLAAESTIDNSEAVIEEIPTDEEMGLTGDISDETNLEKGAVDETGQDETGLDEDYPEDETTVVENDSEESNVEEDDTEITNPTEEISEEVDQEENIDNKLKSGLPPTLTPSEIIGMNVDDFAEVDITDNFKPGMASRAIGAGEFRAYAGRIYTSGGYVTITNTVAPGAVAHYLMEPPLDADVDFNVYLYEVADDGTLIAQIDASEYPVYINSVGKVLVESVGVVNDSAVPKKYMMYIEMSAGFYDGEFLVCCGINTAVDINEANENPSDAIDVTLDTTGNMVINQSWDTRVDGDWYRFQVPADASYEQLVVNCSYQSAEMYTERADGSMELVVEAGHIFTVVPGETYYVNAHNEYYSSVSENRVGNYTLTLMPVPSQLITLMDYSEEELSKVSYDSTYGSQYLINNDFYMMGAYIYDGNQVMANEQVTIGIRNVDNSDFVEALGTTDLNGHIWFDMGRPQLTGSRTYDEGGSPEEVHYYNHGEIYIKRADGTTVSSTNIYLEETVYFAEDVEIIGYSGGTDNITYNGETRRRIDSPGRLTVTGTALLSDSPIGNALITVTIENDSWLPGHNSTSVTVKSDSSGYFTATVRSPQAAGVNWALVDNTGIIHHYDDATVHVTSGSNDLDSRELFIYALSDW